MSEEGEGWVIHLVSIVGVVERSEGREGGTIRNWTGLEGDGSQELEDEEEEEEGGRRV